MDFDLLPAQIKTKRRQETVYSAPLPSFYIFCFLFYSDFHEYF